MGLYRYRASNRAGNRVGNRVGDVQLDAKKPLAVLQQGAFLIVAHVWVAVGGGG